MSHPDYDDGYVPSTRTLRRLTFRLRVEKLAEMETRRRARERRERDDQLADFLERRYGYKLLRRR